MTIETILMYIVMGLVIACVYYIFKIISMGMYIIISKIKFIHIEPEPNRKRKIKNRKDLLAAIKEFNINIYKPIKKDELKKQYIQKIKIVHPDHGGSHEECIRIQQAYNILLLSAI